MTSCNTTYYLFTHPNTIHIPVTSLITYLIVVISQDLSHYIPQY